MDKLIINIKGNDISLTIEYKKRKTLSIEVHPTGEVKVKAPIGVSEERVKEFIKRKGAWIIGKVEKFQEINKNRKVITYESGDKILYLGREYNLRIVNNKQYKKSSVEVLGDKIIVLCVSKEMEGVKLALEKWYRKKALENILHSIDGYVRCFNTKPKSIKIRAAKTRWGSCSYKDDLMFNWKLIMAPQQVIDYVVVHEMCHMNHKNHSKDFWENVEKIIPKYKEYQLWLKTYGYKLDL